MLFILKIVFHQRKLRSFYTSCVTTGLVLRRCSLDAVGLASWEDPTHIKCISKNYENIQTLVSPSLLFDSAFPEIEDSS